MFVCWLVGWFVGFLGVFCLGVGKTRFEVVLPVVGWFWGCHSAGFVRVTLLFFFFWGGGFRV